jgi:ubiquinol-cytochrome c reductase cytochrome c subunit
VKNFLLAAALLCCAVQGMSQTQRNASRAAVANGREVYMRIGCFTCHGTVGHGGAGARLAPGTLPWEAFQFWVRNGTPGWSFMRGMPAYSSTVVSDEQLADVHAYLASLPAPPAVADIPLLNE